MDFQKPLILYSMLELILDQVKAQQWDVAGESNQELGGATRRYMSRSISGKESVWEGFLGRALDLQSAITEHDSVTCLVTVPEMAALLDQLIAVT